MIGQSEHHIKNQEVFINNFHNISLQETNILVSFDVASLFAEVPLEIMLQLLTQPFDSKTIALIRHVLSPVFFSPPWDHSSHL
jgi:hypothetical protein